MESLRTTDDVLHITTIYPRDSSGHYSWTCTCPNGDASGYELAAEVVAAAVAHGPLAADSFKPVDDTDDDDARSMPELPSLAVLLDVARQLGIGTDDIPGGTRARRRTVVAASLAAGLIARVNYADPHFRTELARARSAAVILAVGGNVDSAIALGTVLFRWGTDAVRQFTQDDPIDHLVEALALLIGMHRDDGSDASDESPWIHEVPPDSRLKSALAHIDAAVTELTEVVAAGRKPA
jgi:hypothetical protein